MVEKILNNTTPYGKIRASHEGWLHSSTLTEQHYINLIGEMGDITIIKKTYLKAPRWQLNWLSIEINAIL